MKNYFAALLALLFFAGSFAFPVQAGQESSKAPQIKLLEDVTLKKLTKAEEPAEQHRMLSTLSGTWHYNLQYWTDENAEAQTSSGLMTNEMVLGEKFLSSKTVLIINAGGQNIPYEGWGLLGYDAAKKVFTSVWADRGQVGMITATGKYNAETKTIEEKGSFTHPLLEKEQTYRSELQFTENDTYKRTIFIVGASGKEFKVLEAAFSRHQ